MRSTLDYTCTSAFSDISDIVDLKMATLLDFCFKTNNERQEPVRITNDGLGHKMTEKHIWVRAEIMAPKRDKTSKI